MLLHEVTVHFFQFPRPGNSRAMDVNGVVRVKPCRCGMIAFYHILYLVAGATKRASGEACCQRSACACLTAA